MKLLTFCILVVALVGGFNDIAKVNELKKKAKEAYNSGDYQTALSHYQLLTDSLNVDDESIALNLANAYFIVQDTTKAVNSYSNLIASNDRSIRSVAHQQLGIIKNREKQFKEALNHFKESLRADPLNKDSRYNYELLKKVLEEQEKQDQQDQNKDDQKQDQQDQEKQDQQNKDQEKQNQEQQQGQQQDQEKQDENGEQSEEEKKEGEEKEGKKEEGEKSEEEKEQEAKEQEGEADENQEPEEGEPSFADKLKEMKISEEKAQMILEAMKNNEIQYFQQNKRKAKKKKDPEKPDW